MLSRKYQVLIALSLVLGTTNYVSAGQPSFMALAELPPGLFYTNPDDISSDGSVVVGWADVAPDGGIPSLGKTFRWTRETGMVGIGTSSFQQIRVSADGSTIVSRSSLGAWRWTADTGAVTVPLNFVGSVSGDGSVLVGTATQAARWTEAGGVALLPTAGVYPYGSSGQDISADGSIVLGIGNKQPSSPSSEPFLWSAAGGIVPINLPGGPGSLVRPEFWRISDNGKTVVGSKLVDANNSNSGRGYRWTKETGAVELGLLPDGLWMIPTSVSADGSVIVGYTATDGASISNVQDNKDGRIKPVIWDALHGPRYLVDVLVNEYGLGEALAGWTLSLPRGISGDGRRIIGRSPNPAGDIHAWIAYLGSAATLAGDYNNNGTVDAADYVVWRKNGGTQQDYNTWRANFAAPAGSGATGSASVNSAVPEPSSFMLTGIAAVSLIQLRRRIARRAAVDHRGALPRFRSLSPVPAI